MPKLNVLWQCSLLAALEAMLILLSAGPPEEGEEWEPSVALRSLLEELPLETGLSQREAMARLIPHQEEALRTLTSLESHRGLSEKERIQKEAFEMLLAAAKEVE